MFGSSYKVVRNLNDCSKSFMQSVTALLTIVIVVVIAVVHYSLMFYKVEGCSFNYNSSI